MKVICAGPAKTGTFSIIKALRILGLTVHDWEEQTFDFLDHWVDVFQNGTKPNVERVYRNADAAADMPVPFFFEEILEAFPDCKVILTEREEDAWVKSHANQLEVFYTAKYGLRFLGPLSPTLKKLFFVIMSFIDAMYGSRNPRSTSVFKKRYRAHIDRVKSTVPQEKLLVYKVTQGWKPLCEFLGCEIPKIPFPHENIKGEVAKIPLQELRSGRQIKQELKRSFLAICSFLIIIASIIFAILYF